MIESLSNIRLIFYPTFDEHTVSRHKRLYTDTQAEVKGNSNNSPFYFHVERESSNSAIYYEIGFLKHQEIVSNRNGSDFKNREVFARRTERKC